MNASKLVFLQRVQVRIMFGVNANVSEHHLIIQFLFPLFAIENSSRKKPHQEAQIRIIAIEQATRKAEMISKKVVHI
jgi:hypothetical protein